MLLESHKRNKSLNICFRNYEVLNDTVHGKIKPEYKEIFNDLNKMGLKEKK